MDLLEFLARVSCKPYLYLSVCLFSWLISCSPCRAGSLKDDWSLPRGSKERRYGSDQWAAAPLQRVANHWVARWGRFHPNQFKTTFYQIPAIMECRLYLSAQNCNQKMFGCIFLPPVALMSAGVIKWMFQLCRKVNCRSYTRSFYFVFNVFLL